MKRMTMRERMLAVVRGEAHDRVPFVQYSGLAAPNEEIWAAIGRENMGLLVWTSVHRIETPNCRFVQEEIARNGRNGFRNTLHTPEGSLWEERFLEPAYGTTAAAAHYVKDPSDYNVLLAYLRDMHVHGDVTALGNVVRELGEDGLPHVSLVRTPYQQLWVQWVCLQDLCVHLAMEPEIMEEVIAVMRGVQRRIFAVACEALAEGAPIPYLVFPDNITAPAIGVDYFDRYCADSYRDLEDVMAGHGSMVPIYVHMDGDLRALWHAIAHTPVRGLDSMSPPPDNDTSVAEAMANWPAMRVCINFPSSVHLAEPREIRAQAERILAEGGRTGRLQIQVSENVPRGVWRKSFPEIARATAASGAPAAP